MGGYRHVLYIGASVLTLILSGCMDGSDKAGDAAGEATAFSERPSSSRLVERDVEAPEVFQTTDQGLWDGRPSLGGVWVAHPDVTDPERVIIRNDSNGKFVIGALFKRERDNPGPRLQVSSDAAAALGMLAGAPTALNVTALRREEPAPSADVMPNENAETEATPEQDTETEATIASAAAAITAAESDGAKAVNTETEVAEAEPKKRGWNPFRRKPTDATATAEAVSEVTEAVEIEPEMAALTETATEAVTEVTAEPVAEPAKAKRGWNPFKRKNKETVVQASATGTAALSAGEITSTALDSAPRVIADEAAAAPETLKTVSRLDKPYIQIGIFSVEANANNTATAMRQNGVVPQVYEQKSSGKTFWRVVAGPVNSKVDRAALLKKVKGMGFADAYPVGG